MARFTTDFDLYTPTTTTLILSSIPISEENEINVWLPDFSEIDASTSFWAALNLVLFICILGGNILTIIAVRTCRRLRASISNLFILSLAISDFIVGLALPYHVSFYLGWTLGSSKFLCLLRFFLMIFACCLSMGTLISIAIDRYIAIVYALHYRRYMTRRVAYSIIALNWFIGSVVASIPIFWNKWSSATHCEFDEILPTAYVVGILTPAFIVVWAVMLMLYWRIMREASKQAHQLASCSDWKSIQIVVLIMGCFTVCWLPYFIAALTETFRNSNTETMVYKYALTLATSNSGLNPVIYAWKNSNFRKAFVRILCCTNPNFNAQEFDASHFQSVAKSKSKSKSPTLTPTSKTTIQNHIIILPLCNQSITNGSCLNEVVQNQTSNNHQHIKELCEQTKLDSTENFTCSICKSVLKNSFKLQRNLNLELKTYTMKV